MERRSTLSLRSPINLFKKADYKFYALVSKRAPILSQPPIPLEGGIGRLPFSACKNSQSFQIPKDPVFFLDQRPWYQIPAQSVTTRHRQLEPAFNAFYGNNQKAVAQINSFLDQDVPGLGEPWVHTTDIAARIIHWSAAVDWLDSEADPAFLRKIAGSVLIHEKHLQTRLYPSLLDPRRIHQLAGIITARLTWPALYNKVELSYRANMLFEAIKACFNNDGSLKIKAGEELSASIKTAVLMLKASEYQIPEQVQAIINQSEFFFNLIKPRSGPIVLPMLWTNKNPSFKLDNWFFYRFTDFLFASRNNLVLVIHPNWVKFELNGKMVFEAEIPGNKSPILTHLGLKNLKIDVGQIQLNVSKNKILYNVPKNAKINFGENNGILDIR